MPHVLLYDGVCGLCNRMVRFILERDANDSFRFAALQGAYARALLASHGKDPDDLDTVYVWTDDGRLLSRAAAALFVLKEIGGPWRLLAAAKVLPMSVLDRWYDRVARSRYRVFGRLETCPVPDPRWRAKFLDP